MADRVPDEIGLAARKADTDALRAWLAPIDGVDVGKTPIEQTLPGGEYRVRVAVPERQPVEDMVRITNDRPQAVRNYRLLLRVAQLAFRVKPDDGELPRLLQLV